MFCSCSFTIFKEALLRRFHHCSPFQLGVSRGGIDAVFRLFVHLFGSDKLCSPSAFLVFALFFRWAFPKKAEDKALSLLPDSLRYRLVIGLFFVTFTRPFPDATFHDGYSIKPYTRAGIEITSPKGNKKTIVIWSTGQIEIKNGELGDDAKFKPKSCI